MDQQPHEKVCTACGAAKVQTEFSAKQWKLSGAQSRVRGRKCRQCVALLVNVVEDPGPAPVHDLSGGGRIGDGAKATLRLEVGPQGVILSRADTDLRRAQGPVQKVMPRQWHCDACNAPGPPGSVSTWWTAHKIFGDFALCDPCVAKGVTPDTEAAKHGCAQQ